MRILTKENVESLKIRGYIKSDISGYKSSDFDSLNNFGKYNVNQDPYMSLFTGLNQSGMRNLLRFICLQWKNVAVSLNDSPISNFSSKSPKEIFCFFTEKDHRVYFFIEIVHQYFFP